MHDSVSTDQTLAEALPDGIAVLDAGLSMLWCNQVAKALLDLRDDLAFSLHNTLGQNLTQELLTGQSSETVEINSPVDENVRLSLRLRPYSDGRYILVLQDITHTYHLEAIRQDFVANVSHELRTPLTVFHGYLDILLSNTTIDADKLQDILQQMSGQAARMERLVEDLLLLAKLESVEPDLSKHAPVVLEVLLKEVIHDAMSLSDGRHEFDVSVDDKLVLVGDLQELRSALSNLVFNAVRYTPEGGKIQICGYKHKDFIAVEVIDSGIGIAEKHIPRITQRFYRVDKSRKYRGQGGTGLGLAIVKHVAIRHHAELQIESEFGQGSVFRLLFNEKNAAVR